MSETYIETDGHHDHEHDEHGDHHDHGHDHFAGAPDTTRRELWFAVAITVLVLVGEVAGGLWSHSLALLSDAAHNFTDLISLVLSLVALVIAARPVSKERTYGWHRAEIFAALVNGSLLLLISIGLVGEAYQRLQHPVAVKAGGMLVVAIAGLIANGVIALRLKGHAHDLNIHSAYLHMVADFASSVAVILAAVIIIPTRWYIVDPILSGLIALVVLFGSIRLLRDTGHILLEGTPRHLDLEAVAETVRTVPQVQAIHDLHIWTICSNLLALSVHVTVGDCPGSDRDRVVEEITRRMVQQFGIGETTIQVEAGPCRTEDLIHIVPHHYEQ
jgi:cobalt-zinc-cadmium efflux system protein